jgi:hypothetical protein
LLGQHLGAMRRIKGQPEAHFLVKTDGYAADGVLRLLSSKGAKMWRVLCCPESYSTRAG